MIAQQCGDHPKPASPKSGKSEQMHALPLYSTDFGDSARMSSPQGAFIVGDGHTSYESRAETALAGTRGRSPPSTVTHNAACVNPELEGCRPRADVVLAALDSLTDLNLC